MTYSPKNTQKTEKIGKVTIETYKSSYRLRYTVDGKRESLTVSGGRTEQTLALARKVASQVNLDLATGQYDCTKAKYDKRYESVVQIREFNLRDVWEIYKSIKQEETEKTSQKKIWPMVENALSKVPDELLALDKGIEFVNKLKKHYANSTLGKIGVLLTASINLAIKYGEIENYKPYPFPANVQGGKSSTETFTPEEIQAIISAFKADENQSVYWRWNASHYACLVEFLALTGRRPEDIIALTWDDIIERNGRMIMLVNKAYCKGVLKSTKNGLTTIYPLNTEMMDCLRRQGKQENENNLVFPSQTGKYIDWHNFTNRY
jgi:integrase